MVDSISLQRKGLGWERYTINLKHVLISDNKEVIKNYFGPVKPGSGAKLKREYNWAEMGQFELQ